MQCLINGTPVEVIASSLNINDAIEERSTATFTVRDDAGAFTFHKGQPVQILDNDDNLIFTGFIDTPQAQKTTGSSLKLHTIDCVDNHYLADKRVIAKAYQNMLAGDIVQDIIDNYLNQEDITGKPQQPIFSRNSVAYNLDGSQVAANVPRFQPGKFGQGILTEESISNLFTNGDLSNGIVGWSTNFSLDSSVYKYGTQSLKYSNNGSSTGYIYKNVSGSNGDKYYASAWVYLQSNPGGSSNGVYISMANLAGNSGLGSSYCNPATIGSWQKLSCIVTGYAGDAGVQYRIYSYNDSCIVNVDGLMLINLTAMFGKGNEPSKAYMDGLTFANGTRSPESLTIPTTNVLNPKQGTVECIINLNRAPGINTQFVFSTGMTNTDLDLYVRADGKLEVSFPIGNPPYTTVLVTGSTILNPNTNYAVCVKWSGNGVFLYLNGILQASSTAVPKFTFTSANAYIGSYSQNLKQLDGIIDDLRISSVARSDDDILNAYNSNQPLPYDEFSTYKLDFDNELNAPSHIQDGPEIEQAIFNYISITAALDSLSEQANFIWYVGFDLQLHFVDRSTYESPWSCTGDDIVGDSLVVGEDNPQYRNKQYIKGGTDVTDPITENFHGDGATRTWNVGFKIDSVPSITLNGTPIASSDIGIRSVDTGKKYYWAKGENAITQDESQTLLTASNTLSITYQGQFDIVAITEDPEEIYNMQAIEGIGTGIVEEVEDEPDNTSRDAAFQSGNAKLQKYATIGNKITFRTLRYGLKPGQLLTMNIPEHNLNNTEVLVESINTTDESGIFLYYDVTAVEGPEEGSWAKMFQKMATKGQVFVIRENISEDQVLITLTQFSKTWQQTDPNNIFIEVYPSSILYPGNALYPMFEYADRIKYIELLDSSNNTFLRKKITKQTGPDTTNVVSTTYIAPFEANASIAKVRFYGGSQATDAVGSGILIDEQVYSKVKTQLEALQIDKIDIRGW